MAQHQCVLVLFYYLLLLNYELLLQIIPKDDRVTLQTSVEFSAVPYNKLQSIEAVASLRSKFISGDE